MVDVALPLEEVVSREIIRKLRLVGGGKRGRRPGLVSGAACQRRSAAAGHARACGGAPGTVVLRQGPMQTPARPGDRGGE
jgi:hypothetical protein